MYHLSFWWHLTHILSAQKQKSSVQGALFELYHFIVLSSMRIIAKEKFLNVIFNIFAHRGQRKSSLMSVIFLYLFV